MIPALVISARFMGWCVYVWKRSNPEGADRVMYVGMSANGIRRFAGHHALPTDYTDDDYVEVFPCYCELTAVNLEQKLIVELKPKLNKKITFKNDEITSTPMRQYFRKHLPVNSDLPRKRTLKNKVDRLYFLRGLDMSGLFLKLR